MSNSFLQGLIDEVASVESAEMGNEDPIEVVELLEANVQATEETMESVSGLIEALESNFEYHFAGDKEVSFESYKNYEHTTSLILKAHGLNVPTALAVPAFEADEPKEATAAKAEEKKDNIVVRAGKQLWKLIQQLARWVKELFSKKAPEAAKEAEDLSKDAEELAEEMKKPEGEAKPSTESSEAKTYKHLSPEAMKGAIAILGSFQNAVKDSENMFQLFRTINENNVKEVEAKLADMTSKYEKLTEGYKASFKDESKLVSEYTYDRLKSARHVEEVKLIADAVSKLMRDLGAWVKTVESRINEADEKRIGLLAGPEASKAARMEIADLPRKCEALARLFTRIGRNSIKEIRAAM